MIKIKETPYRNLNINPEYKSGEKFFVYNYKGVLKPYNPEIYYNREVMGASVNMDYLTKGVTYDYELNLNRKGRDTPPIKIGLNFDRTMFKKVAKDNLELLRGSNYYPDLGVYSDDEIIQKMFNTIDKLNTTREAGLKYYDSGYIKSIDTYKNENQTASSIDIAMYKNNLAQIEATKKLIRMSPAKTLTEEQFAAILFNCIKQRTDLGLEKLQNEACKELNKYKEGTCKEPSEISTLEIRSDFIQDIYPKAITNSIKDFYFIIYYSYDNV